MDAQGNSWARSSLLDAGVPRIAAPQVASAVEVSTIFRCGRQEFDCTHIYTRSDLLALLLDVDVSSEDDGAFGSSVSAEDRLRPLVNKLFVPLCVFADRALLARDALSRAESEAKPASVFATMSETHLKDLCHGAYVSAAPAHAEAG